MPTGHSIFSIAGALARHAAARQAVIAGNVANADTPGFRAKDLEPFAKVFDAAAAAGEGATFRERIVESLGSASPNGNTVSIEDQMMRAAEARRDHDLATTIYAKSLSMLKAALGGRR